jgi:hypothetical protein
MSSHLELHLGPEILDPHSTMAQLGLGSFPTFDMSTNVSVFLLELGVFNNSCSSSAPHLEARKINYSCIPTSALHWELGNYLCRLDSAPCIGPEISFHHLNQPFVVLRIYLCPLNQHPKRDLNFFRHLNQPFILEIEILV